MASSDAGYINPGSDNLYTDSLIPGAPGGGYYTDGSMTNTTNPPGTTGGGSNNASGVNLNGLPGFLQNVGQTLTGSGNPLTNALVVPALATAAQQWHNADTYKQLGQDAANRADPFGKYRGYYGDMLQNLYKDPSQIENTPGYKFAMNQTMNNTAAKLASQGFLGSSQMQNALAAQSSGLAQQTWNTEANRLAQLSGSQFDPANAGRFMMQGGQLAVDAQNGALASMFMPFAMGAGGTNVNVGGSGGGGTTGAGGVSAVDAGRIGSAAINAISSGGAAGFQAASKLLDQGIRYINMPDGTTVDLQQYEQHGADNGSGDTTPYYPTQTAIDDSQNPGSQFYTPPDTSNININDYVPIDDNNPYAGMSVDDFINSPMP